MPKPAKAKREDDVRKEPLTAVLLADSFSVRFRPITVECPKALIPLVNAPLIEYALEWLASSGVEVCHVVCCAHADTIKAHITDSAKWSSCSMTINFITSYNCMSAGEALRLVDQKGLIKDDFILLSTDCVTNLGLKAVFEEHKARRASDSSAIMTMVVAPGYDEGQRIQMGMSDLAITLDPQSKRLLSYLNFTDHSVAGQTQGGSVSLQQSSVNIDTTFFSERDVVELRYDLADAAIYICAPEVLVLFSDNFDFQHIQRDFIPGVLSEEELGNKLFVHVAGNCYAAHIANMRTYAAVSMDIMMRWTYPLCPDSNLLPPASHLKEYPSSDYFFSDNYVYKDSGVSIVRGTKVGEQVCIGAGTHIGEKCNIRRSVLGRGCQIGNNVVIYNSFLMANVVVRSGAQVTNAIICNDCVVGERAVVSRGAVISNMCTIGPGHKVAPYARVSLCQTNDEDIPDDSSVEVEAQGRRTVILDEDSDDGSVQEYGPSAATLQAAHAVRMGQRPDVAFDTEAVGEHGAGFDYLKQQALTVSPLEELTSVALPSVEVARDRVKLLTTRPVAQDEDTEELAAVSHLDSDPEFVFKHEVQETLLRVLSLAHETNLSKSEMVENAVLELNGLKIAEVRSFADCARYVLTTIMSLQAPAPRDVNPSYRSLYASDAPDVTTKPGQLVLLRAFTSQLEAWAPILRRFLHDDDDQIELLLTLEEYCGSRAVFAGTDDYGRLYVPIFSHVLVQLYEKDIIAEDVFLLWEEEKQGDDEDDQEFLKHAAEFLEWLKQDSDDGEEDSDEDA